MTKEMISFEYLKEAGLQDNGSIILTKDFMDSTQNY